MTIRPGVAILALLLGGSAAAQKLCPDGTFVGGDTCKLCPDGTFVSGDTCKLAPDGTFVGTDRNSRAVAGGSVAAGALQGLGAALMRRSDQEREDKLRAEDRAHDVEMQQPPRRSAAEFLDEYEPPRQPPRFGEYDELVISTAETWQCVDFVEGGPVLVVATTDTPDEPMLGSLSVAGIRYTAYYDVDGFYRRWAFGPADKLELRIAPNGEGVYLDFRGGSLAKPREVYSCRMVTAASAPAPRPASATPASSTPSPAGGVRALAADEDFVPLDTLLDAAHPDWEEVVANPGFTQWLDGQPSHIREAANRNNDEIVNAVEAADVVSRFKIYLRTR